MILDNIATSAQKYFPDLKIAYKDQSFWMKVVGKILFFNPGFMSAYTTTIGSTVYFPNKQFIQNSDIISSAVLLHELVHMHDDQKRGRILYSLQYMFPQSLILLCLPLFFFFWKVALVLTILLMLPLPAYFRMVLEKRAYLCSLYALNAFGKKFNLSDSDLQNMLDKNKNLICKEFSGPSYYYMWIFSSLKNDFDKGANLIKAGKRPYEDPVFDMIDDLLSKT